MRLSMKSQKGVSAAMMEPVGGWLYRRVLLGAHPARYLHVGEFVWLYLLGGCRTGKPYFSSPHSRPARRHRQDYPQDYPQEWPLAPPSTSAPRREVRK